MTSIQRTDLLQITARSCGITLLSLTMSGATNLSDVFRHVRQSAPTNIGIVTVSLRNRTQGWTQQHNLVFTRSATGKFARTSDEYPSLFA